MTEQPTEPDPAEPVEETPPTEPPPTRQQDLDPRLVGGLDLIRRCGAVEVTFGYADEVKPALWWAWAHFRTDRAGIPRGDGREHRYEAAAAMSPLRAVLRLGETLIDGSVCRHCGRPAGLDPDSIEQMPADRLFCWYQWDPELRVYRRGCEGDTVAKIALHGPPYTRHGHLVDGYSPEGWPAPTSVARCGGPAICPRCATDAERIRRREG